MCGSGQSKVNRATPRGDAAVQQMVPQAEEINGNDIPKPSDAELDRMMKP